MSAAAMSAVRQCYAILGMDTSSLRHKWAREIGEGWRATFRRRREMLVESGDMLHLSAQYREWDELPESVRDAMNAALLD